MADALSLPTRAAAPAQSASEIAVIVATCDRPEQLEACLRSLAAQTHRPAVIVVVDDAPGGEVTPAVVARLATGFPIRYVEGRRGGLGDAHNRGLEHVDTPLVAFTDDDVIAEARWLERVVAAFDADERVGCVTGMIEPLELRSDVQLMLEGYAGFNKGEARRVYDLDAHRPDEPLFPFAAGQLGSGANMSFRRSVLEEMGGFDPALGAGTRARSGDDLLAFFEVIQNGHRLVYEPEAVVRHRHADTMQAFERQVYGYGVGLTAYLTRCLLGRPRLLPTVLRRLPRAIAYVLDPCSLKNARLPPDYPPAFRRRERLGMVVGPFAYLASRREVRRRHARAAHATGPRRARGRPA
ncbi:MAG TPA: glycosyltransferase family A protein [Solirubrobacteraceae bacterium]|nr:glycosyltransferase family A protein [Solirubrobacteraceae bacterium]